MGTGCPTCRDLAGLGAQLPRAGPSEGLAAHGGSPPWAAAALILQLCCCLMQLFYGPTNIPSIALPIFRLLL